MSDPGKRNNAYAGVWRIPSLALGKLKTFKVYYLTGEEAVAMDVAKHGRRYEVGHPLATRAGWRWAAPDLPGKPQGGPFTSSRTAYKDALGVLS